MNDAGRGARKQIQENFDAVQEQERRDFMNSGKSRSLICKKAKHYQVKK